MRISRGEREHGTQIAPPAFPPRCPGADISPETIEYHYGKHHAAYVDNLNKLIPGTEFAKASLEEIIRNAAGRDLQQRRPGLEPHILLELPGPADGRRAGRQGLADAIA